MAEFSSLTSLVQTTKQVFKNIKTLEQKIHHFKKATKQTYFQGVFSNARLNSAAITVALTPTECLIIKEYDEALSDLEHDNAFLNIYMKLANNTGFKCATKYRSQIVCKYWGFNDVKQIRNKAAKFYITYIDPFNTKGQTSFVQYMRMKSHTRRAKYFEFYRQFDAETNNSISIFAQDAQECNYLEEEYLNKCNRLGKENKNNIAYDTSYIPLV